MKKSFLACAMLLVSGLAQAGEAAAANSEASPYLLVLSGVALIGTIVHRRNMLKSRG
jgi:hypothetical protein